MSLILRNLIKYFSLYIAIFFCKKNVDTNPSILSLIPAQQLIKFN